MSNHDPPLQSCPLKPQNAIPGSFSTLQSSEVLHCRTSRGQDRLCVGQNGREELFPTSVPFLEEWREFFPDAPRLRCGQSHSKNLADLRGTSVQSCRQVRTSHPEIFCGGVP